jgi:PAS domain S-box-containing protein
MSKKPTYEELEQRIQELEKAEFKRKKAEKALHESEERYRSLFQNNHAVLLLIDPDSAKIIDANPAAVTFYGWTQKELTQKRITDINTLSSGQVFREMELAKAEQRRQFNFRHRLATGETLDVEVYSGPIIVNGKKLLYSIVHDISSRKRAEKALVLERNKLQEALEKIKALSGMLPICSNCKKIRDDKGYWNQIEFYIREHSEAEFSHSICPECIEIIYPDLDMCD